MEYSLASGLLSLEKVSRWEREDERRVGGGREESERVRGGGRRAGGERGREDELPLRN
jgi:hypothetical protein